MKNERIYKMTFSRVYPLLVQKAEKKGRTKKEVNFETFFAEAPQINPNADKIKGVVCGVRVEEIYDPLIKKIRCLDKLVDELAKGKAMEKVLRG